MFLKCGTIIPFQHKDVKKLVVVGSADETRLLTIDDVKNAVRSAFAIDECKFFNKKIGFQIPEDVLIPYLGQRRDVTNFIIEIVEHDVCVAKQVVENTNYIDTYLNDLLKSSRGKNIPQNCSRLDKKERQLLTELIAFSEYEKSMLKQFSHFVENQKYLEWAAAIVRKFPEEDMATYYVPPSKRAKRVASGALYDSFNELKCNYLQMRGDDLPANEKAEFPELENLMEIDNWVAYFKAWQQTFKIRLPYTRYIYNPLPYYGKFIAKVGENALKLIEYDFERLHPMKSNRLMENWDKLSDIVFTEAIASCRNDVPLILDLYGNISQLCGLMMLGYFLENFESDFKHFQKDDPGNLVVHIETIITGKPMDVFKEYCQTHNQLDLMVFVVGTNVEELRFYVLVGDSLYSMESALKAVDFCFKCYQVLQLPYPEPQKKCWQVLQTTLYNIKLINCDHACVKFLNIFENT